MEQIIPQSIEAMRKQVSETLSELDQKQVVDCDFLAQGFKQLRARLAQGDFQQPEKAELKKAKTLEDMDLNSENRVRVVHFASRSCDAHANATF